MSIGTDLLHIPVFRHNKRMMHDMSFAGKRVLVMGLLSIEHGIGHIELSPAPLDF